MPVELQVQKEKEAKATQLGLHSFSSPSNPNLGI